MPLVSSILHEEWLSRTVQPQRLRWGWPIDVLMAVLILALLNALALAGGKLFTFKAKSAEQMLALTSWRNDVVENYALTGDWKFSAGNLPRDYATAAPSAIKWDSRYASAGVMDGVIVSLGNYPGHLDGTVILPMRAAVPEKAAQQPVIIWLCGTAEAPPGWAGPPLAHATNLPYDHLFSVCRRRPPP